MLTGEVAIAPSKRDEGATGIDELVALYQDRLLNFVSRLLGSREDAEEVVQDTFARADRALRRATPDRPIDPTPAWFYTIALNTARNRVRRRRVETVRVADATQLADLRAASRAEQPETATERREMRRDIEEALARLPDHQRAPVILRYIEELSYEEIAAVLRCPVGTAKSHVHRGTRRLRRDLAQLVGRR